MLLFIASACLSEGTVGVDLTAPLPAVDEVPTIHLSASELDFDATRPGEPQESVVATLSFDPTTALDYEDTLSVSSNDPDTPVATTTLFGLGIAPVLELLPSEIEVGLVPVGCNYEVDFFLSNAGNEDLVVEDYAFAADSMEVVDTPTLPWELDVGEDMQLTVVYTPTQAVFEEGKLTLVSNDPLGDGTNGCGRPCPPAARRGSHRAPASG